MYWKIYNNLFYIKKVRVEILSCTIIGLNDNNFKNDHIFCFIEKQNYWIYYNMMRLFILTFEKSDKTVYFVKIIRFIQKRSGVILI